MFLQSVLADQHRPGVLLFSSWDQPFVNSFCSPPVPKLGNHDKTSACFPSSIPLC